MAIIEVLYLYLKTTLPYPKISKFPESEVNLFLKKALAFKKCHQKKSSLTLAQDCLYRARWEMDLKLNLKDAVSRNAIYFPKAYCTGYPVVALD